MKHSGKARQAALKLVLWTLAGLLAIFVACIVAVLMAAIVWEISAVLVGLWVVFALFTFYFFRDPEAKVPSGAGLVLSPAHGKVDAIENVTEPRFMGGPCQRHPSRCDPMVHARFQGFGQVPECGFGERREPTS